MLTEEALLAGEKSIASTLRKEEKAYATLTAKRAREWQLARVAADLENFRTMLTLLHQALHREPFCQVEQARIEAAYRAIPGYIGQIQKILPKFRQGTPQHTLGIRRIQAYQTAAALLRARMENGCKDPRPVN